MRTFLLVFLLGLPMSAAAQRLPLSLCTWNGHAFARVQAYYDRDANALFAGATGAGRFDVSVATDSTRGYARNTGWYRHDETVRLGEAYFASWRAPAAMDDTGLEFAGRRGTVPFFRRAGDRIETRYVLVGPAFRAEGPLLYTPEGRCEFQPYRLVTMSNPTSGNTR